MAKLRLERDPRLYKLKPKHGPQFRRCLGLDLGTTTGVAIADFVPSVPLTKKQLMLGQWDLSLGQWDSGPLRFIRLKQFLAVAEPDLVMFEDVRFTPGQEMMGRNVGAIVARVATAAELLGAMKITLTTWCEEHAIPSQGLGIGQIKKHATGKGNANKIDMIKACNSQFGTKFNTTEEALKQGIDNMADAAFACDIGLTLYTQGL
jgi:hypothetical protein